MRKSIISSFLTLACSVGFSAAVVKSGHIVTGFDRELDLILTKKITATLDKSGPNVLEIEDEGALEGFFEEGKISAYSVKPKKYFYYSLELKPKTGFVSGQTLVIRQTDGVSTSYCKEGANALLTGFVGDGTKKTFCVTLK